MIDTSVLCEILEVPGKAQRHNEILQEFKKRDANGDKIRHSDHHCY